MTLRTTIEDRVQVVTNLKNARSLSKLERSRTGMVFEPNAHLEDPYSHYAQFRKRDPVHHQPRVDGFVLTRHADCLEILRDPRFTSDNRQLRVFDAIKAQRIRDGGNTSDFDNPSMMGLDGPAHTRLRALVSRGFTPRAISALVPRIEGIVTELLDPVQPGSAFDWMQTVAHPMPSIVIAEMLGVPKEDRSRFLAWSADMMGGGPLETRARRRRAISAGNALAAYFVEIIQSRRADPGPDILSELIRAEEEDGDRLNFNELIATCILLLLAGHAGTSAMLGNGLLALLQHPEQRLRLRDDAELWPGAVEEMLRFEGAVPSLLRIATEEVRIHGKRLRSGQTALLVLASANRDPEVFEEPDRFDISRHPNDHLALGRGQHFCLGASLARLEMRIALNALLERFENLELCTLGLSWNPRGLRSLTRLPLRGFNAARSG